MFGCASATVVLASSTKRRTNSSSYASSSRICLTTSLFSNPPAPRSVASTTLAMPPRASSRSSTYLPNTWGYIRCSMGSSHRSKRAVALVFALGGAACRRDADVTVRTVTLHAPAACAAGTPPLDGGAYGVFRPLGDFDPQPPATGHALGAVGEPLPEIDGAARFVVVDATEDDRSWTGGAAVPPTGGVDVLLLPSLASCALSAAVGPRTGARLGAVGSGRALLSGGGAGGDLTTYVARLDTGEVHPARPDLLTPRVRASVTPFGSGGLVAGGVDPRPGGAVLATAEVYVADLDGFDQQHPVLLSGPRADHGAVVLATGETLLVGGVAADGVTVLDSTEVVDPATRTVRSEAAARLTVARRAPTVLRLASGEVLVAGGFDAAGDPVTTLEWLSPDATHATKRARDLVAGSARAFVPLSSGGALAVVAPPPGAPSGFQNVWEIDADGAI